MSESDAELIERARRVKNRLSDLYAGGVASADAESFATVAQAERLIGDMLDRLAEPWRSPDAPPAILDLVFVRIGKDCVEIGYHTEEYLCGWADRDGRVLCGVTGWKPIVRPLP